MTSFKNQKNHIDSHSKADVANHQQEFQDIFSRLKQKVKTRESSVESQLGQRRPQTPECRCDGVSFYYVDKKEHPFSYKVCEAHDPTPNCPDCEGTGVVFDIAPLKGVSKGRPYTERVALDSCHCRKIHKNIQKLNDAQIPDRYKEADFSTQIWEEYLNETNSKSIQKNKDKFIKKYKQNLERILRFCESSESFFLRKKPLEKSFLTLVGGVGTGKTHLACAVLKELILNAGCTGYFVDFSELLQKIRLAYEQQSSDAAVLAPLKKADVLVIDEFGKGRTDKQWQLEMLDQLVNMRYNRGQVTILTTNYLPTELFELSEHKKNVNLTGNNEGALNYESYQFETLKDRVGERMYDRLLEVSYWIDFMNLPSFRLRQAQKFLSRYRSYLSQLRSKE